MTGNPLSRMEEEGEAEQRNAKRSDDDISLLKKEMEEHDANMEDRNVRRDTAKDFRWMRRWVVISAIAHLCLLPVILFLMVSVASWMMGVATIEAIKTPLTVLIIGTFVSTTTIYCAMLYGLFRSESDKKESWAHIHPFVSDLLKALRRD